MLLTALSEKDYVSQGHVERLVKMAECMADELGLQEMEKRNLVLLTKVHDLGKIGIPDDILNKPGKLTNTEYDRMKQHVRIGFNIASRSKELANVARLILHHHEHWDGRGYPDGLKKDAIPLECRILGVLDAYDAMTNERPYHKGISKEEALTEINRCSGSQFDPVIAIKFHQVASNFS
jgi:HD-GYP domain-containing protein (c-di-GMP phosphodiesterase class II)